MHVPRFTILGLVPNPNCYFDALYRDIFSNILCYERLVHVFCIHGNLRGLIDFVLTSWSHKAQNLFIKCFSFVQILKLKLLKDSVIKVHCLIPKNLFNYCLPTSNFFENTETRAD